jgi:hypothetical protein
MRDATLPDAGRLLPGTAFQYALDPERFRVDFKTCQFVAVHPCTTVHFVRTDVAPGMMEPADIVRAQGLILGDLGVDTPKDIRPRLAMNTLGVPFKYVPGCCSSAARVPARREINFLSESPPSYRGVVEPSLVREGRRSRSSTTLVFDGKDFSVPDSHRAPPALAPATFCRGLKNCT